MLIKYLVSGGIAFGIDIFTFGTLRFLTLPLMVANPLARLTGALTAFTFNRQWTFKRVFPRSWQREFVYYGLLWCFSTLCSTAGLAYLVQVFPKLNDVFFKILVESIIVAMNYVVSRFWVFRPDRKCVDSPPKDSFRP